VMTVTGCLPDKQRRFTEAAPGIMHPANKKSGKTVTEIMTAMMIGIMTVIIAPKEGVIKTEINR